MWKITYIATYATGVLHQMFDTCFLHVCALVSSRVDCYKHKSTIGFIKEKGNQYGYINDIFFHPIHIISEKGRFSVLFKGIIGAFQNLLLYSKCSSERIVVFNYNNVFALRLLNFACKIKKTKLIVVCHGEMDLLQDDRGGLLAKLNRKILKSFFYHSSIAHNFHFIVLGDSIYKNLKSCIPANSYKHFFSINHPYYIESKPYEHRTKSIRELNLGLIGTLSVEKGLESFMNFVELLDEKQIKCNYSIVGRLNTHDYDDFMNMHNIDIAWNYLSREEMEERVSRLDCVLYFYPSNSYKLIASGAIFDPISMRIPVVAIKNDFFEYVFREIKYPAYLCNDINEMASIIESQVFLQYPDSNIDWSAFSPEKVANCFNEILKSIS